MAAAAGRDQRRCEGTCGSDESRATRRRRRGDEGEASGRGDVELGLGITCDRSSDLRPPTSDVDSDFNFNFTPVVSPCRRLFALIAISSVSSPASGSQFSPTPRPVVCAAMLPLSQTRCPKRLLARSGFQTPPGRPGRPTIGHRRRSSVLIFSSMNRSNVVPATTSLVLGRLLVRLMWSPVPPIDRLSAWLRPRSRPRQ